MNAAFARHAAAAFSWGILVGSTFPHYLHTTYLNMVNQTPYTQPLTDMGKCILTGPADAQRSAIIGLLQEFGYGDVELESLDEPALINLAKQYVVAFCGPTAWSGE